MNRRESMMSEYKHADDLLDFLSNSPTAAAAVSSLEAKLKARGFRRLSEYHSWNLNEGDQFYVIRSSSSIIAGIMGSKPCWEAGCRIIGSHTDFPGFRIKPCPDRKSEGIDILGVEVYGGPIISTWFDRDLSLAGTLAVLEENSVRRIPFRLDRPIFRMAGYALNAVTNRAKQQISNRKSS